MGSDAVELNGSTCPKCGEEKNVSVSITSSCRECGLDSLFVRYEIPGDKIKGVLSAIFRILDDCDLTPKERLTGISTFEELVNRLNS